MAKDKRQVQIDFYNQNSEWQTTRGKSLYVDDMFKLMPPISGNVLEVSAGRFTRRIMGSCDKLTVIDISEGALKTIEDVPCEKVLGDAADMPFESNEFDYVVGFGVLHHVADPQKSLSESVRVARHGVYYLIERNPLELYFSAKVLLSRRKEEYGMFHLPAWKYRRILDALKVKYRISITDFASVGFPDWLYNSVRKFELKYLRKLPFIMNFASHINIYIDLDKNI